MRVESDIESGDESYRKCHEDAGDAQSAGLSTTTSKRAEDGSRDQQRVLSEENRDCEDAVVVVEVDQGAANVKSKGSRAMSKMKPVPVCQPGEDDDKTDDELHPTKPCSGCCIDYEDQGDDPQPCDEPHGRTGDDVQQGNVYDEVRNFTQAVTREVQGAMGGMLRELHGLVTEIHQDRASAHSPAGNAVQKPQDEPTPFIDDKDDRRRFRPSRRKQPVVTTRRTREESSSSSSDDSTDRDEHSSGHKRKNQESGTKLPPFLGTESWDVWINRFEDVATRRGWSEEEKLDAILPRLQGKAGEFVYGQLRKKIRNDYQLLTRELRNRFRKVETRKTYGTKFSRRSQQGDETVEEFAGELKRLYDKAHPQRDEDTRREDLLRRFLDGLKDTDAAFQVEYVKEPIDIDEAVYEVVNYIESHQKDSRESGEQRRGRKAARIVKENSDLEEEDRVARLPGRPPKQTGQASAPDQANGDGSTAAASSLAHPEPFLTELKSFREELRTQYSELSARVGRLEKLMPTNAKPRVITSQATHQPSNSASRSSGPGQQLLCFNCGQAGHFARSCLNAPVVMGQFQMAAGSQARPQQATTHSHSQPMRSNLAQGTGN